MRFLFFFFFFPVVDTPSLQVFKRCADVAFRDRVQCGFRSAGSVVGCHDYKGPLMIL